MRKCVIVDLDGTLADVEHRRHLVTGKRRNFKAFHEACAADTPNAWCVALVESMRDAGHEVLLVSGRSQAVEKETLEWLGRVFRGNLDGIKLALLAHHGASRPDTELKREWLRAFGKEKVLFVVEDRARVVRMWREEGVVCLQCDDWEERERDMV